MPRLTWIESFKNEENQLKWIKINFEFFLWFGCAAWIIFGCCRCRFLSAGRLGGCVLSLAAWSSSSGPKHRRPRDCGPVLLLPAQRSFGVWCQSIVLVAAPFALGRSLASSDFHWIRWINWPVTLFWIVQRATQTSRNVFRWPAEATSSRSTAQDPSVEFALEFHSISSSKLVHSLFSLITSVTCLLRVVTHSSRWLSTARRVTFSAHYSLSLNSKVMVLHIIR